MQRNGPPSPSRSRISRRNFPVMTSVLVPQEPGFAGFISFANPTVDKPPDVELSPAPTPSLAVAASPAPLRETVQKERMSPPRPYSRQPAGLRNTVWGEQDMTDGCLKISTNSFASFNKSRPLAHLVKELVQNALDAVGDYLGDDPVAHTPPVAPRNRRGCLRRRSSAAASQNRGKRGP